MIHLSISNVLSGALQFVSGIGDGVIFRALPNRASKLAICGIRLKTILSVAQVGGGMVGRIKT
jgi:hypothetical protein